jgi:predicted Zn-dependent protease
MAADYAGLRDVAEARKEAAALAASPACQKELHERAERDRRDKDLLARAPGILARGNPGNEPVTATQIATELKIPELRKRAESSNREESLSAKRILNTYLGQTLFYQPQSFIEKKEYDRAIFMLTVGAEIRPDDPGIWVSIASVQARKGKPGRKKALEALHTAVDKGLSDPAALDGEGFADLRQDEDFQRILAQVTERHRGAKAG